MKNKFVLYYILLLMVFIAACKISGADNNNRGNKHNNTFQLSGNITFTSDYCGGAKPPKDLLEGLATPTPYLGKVFYIRSGERNDVTSPVLYTVISDSLGHYSVNLQPGNYCMIDEFRKDTSFMFDVYKKDPNNFLVVHDKKCLENWFNSCFNGFTISNADISNVNFNIHRSCFRPEGVPCIDYDGPLPQ